VVTAITKFGIYDHDLRWARIDLKTLNDLLQIADIEPMYKVRVLPKVSLDDLALRIQETMGSTSRVKRWSDVNQNIFLAVQHQKKLLFLVLEIIIGLAAMNVVNLLLMSSHQRRRDVAILRAMGMRLYQVFSFFVLQGVAVGTTGIVIGIGLGLLVCKFVERFQPAILSEAIYNVNRLPIQVEWLDVTLVAVVAFLVCLVFSLLPALRAALARPVNALRYE
jgi:lipoprotein-releasing system permease protein